ncbi:MAG: hypothetical protein CSA50_09090 [Gammaproteobacteria bacterium]|nr:MAG: hypothetical protein CSA50_09090 [Gammaproteobacteria bacterium]
MLDKFKWIISVLAVVSLVSCGGGSGNNYIVGGNGNNGSGSSSGGNNGSTGGTTVDKRIADLEVSVSSRQLDSDGSEPVIISAIVKDSYNNILSDVDVHFAVDNGGTIEPDAGNKAVTDAEGNTAAGKAVKTAKLTPGYRKENRTLVVTVTAGTQKRSIEVEVTGTSLDLNGPESVVLNTTGTYTVTLTDSAGQPVAYEVVSVVSEQGNAVTPTSDSGFATDKSGQLTFELTAASSGKDTLTVSALGASAIQKVAISGDNFALSSSNTEIHVNIHETVNLVWTKNGVPQVHKTIRLNATRGVVPASVTTDANGRASFTLSSVTAGGTVVTAADAESGLNTTLVREFVAVSPRYLTAQPEQNNISPEGQTALVAIVRDEAYNPVKNQKVRFNIIYDTVNGSLSAATAVTDSLGRASVVYTAGNASSSRDGVEIQASLMDNPQVVDTIKLSVGDRAVQIVLGHDENMAEDGIYYKKTFGVIVTDSAGNPVANKAVNFTLMPVEYYKGQMVCNAAVSKNWQPYVTASCDAEDANDNAILDVGEDFNGNGLLDPTHTAAITNRSVVTDAEGKATVEVVHLQSHALWSKVRLTASTSVDGTAYVESLEFVLDILASDVDNCPTEPTPNPISPYGVAAQCESPD